MSEAPLSPFHRAGPSSPAGVPLPVGTPFPKGVLLPKGVRLLAGVLLSVAGLLLAAAGCGEGGTARDAAARGSGSAGVEAAAPGTADGATGFPLTVTDDSGREIRLSSPPERIVSLVPSATEILLALDAGDRLVARTEYDTASAVAHLPSVGGGLQPGLETLLVVEPDLVIRFAGESDPATAERLDAAGIPHLAVRPDGIADVLRIAARLGRLVGEGGRARALTDRIEAELDSVRSRVRGLPRPRVAYVVGGTPPWVAGPGTFVHELIGVAGGENAFGDLGELYPVVSPEEFVAREIDLLLVPPGASLDRALREIPRRTVPPGLQRPGPHLHEGARALARILHPEAFP